MGNKHHKRRERGSDRIRKANSRHTKKRGRIKWWVERGIGVILFVLIFFVVFFLPDKRNGANESLTADPVNAERVVNVDSLILTAASMDHSAWVRDGQVYIAGPVLKNQEAIKDWQDIVQIAVSDAHIIGLSRSGRVYATGEQSGGQCQIDGLENVVYIAAGLSCSAAVMSDGSIRAFGLMDENWINGLRMEQNATRISMSPTNTVILHADGTVSGYGSVVDSGGDFSTWVNVTDVSAGGSFVLGLTRNGKVLFMGENNNGLAEIANLTDAKSVHAGTAHAIVVMKDGTARAAGRNNKGECNVDNWLNVVSAAAGYDHSLCIRQDGTVSAIGYNGNGQCDMVAGGAT